MGLALSLWRALRKALLFVYGISFLAYGLCVLAYGLHSVVSYRLTKRPLVNCSRLFLIDRSNVSCQPP